MASTVPISGSAYTYAYATLGELIAWIIGWDLILEYAVGATTVAIGWSGYVVSLVRDFGIDAADALRLVASSLTMRPSTPGRPTGAILNVPAVVIIIDHHGAPGRRHPRDRRGSTTSSSRSSSW